MCIVLDQSTEIFPKRGGAYQNSQVCKTTLVKVDRNKYLTLDRSKLGTDEYKTTHQIRQVYNYLINLGRVTSDVSHIIVFELIAINFSHESPHFSLHNKA